MGNLGLITLKSLRHIWKGKKYKIDFQTLDIKGNLKVL